MFKNDRQFLYWAKTQGLRDEVIDELAEIRRSCASRVVQGGRDNVTVDYPSIKMGRIIQAESRSLEFAGVMEYEHCLNMPAEERVLEFYDQPCTLDISYLSPSGRQVSVTYTPDYLVIRKESAGFEEFKSESDLNRLSKTMPNRYVKGEDGRWRCPPAEKAAKEKGFYFRIRTEETLDPILIANCDFLDDFLRYERPEVDNETVLMVREYVLTHDATLAKIQEDLQISLDTIIYLFLDDQIYIDLRQAHLVRPEFVRIYSNELMANPQALDIKNQPEQDLEMILHEGTWFLWNGLPWKILHIGLTDITLLDEHDQTKQVCIEVFRDIMMQGQIQLMPQNKPPQSFSEDALAILARATPKEIAVAEDRFNQIREFLETGNYPVACGESIKRKYRRWANHYRTSENEFGNGLIGLLPKSKRGHIQLAPIIFEMAEEAAQKYYDSGDFNSKKAVYDLFCEDIEKLTSSFSSSDDRELFELTSPSHTWFYDFLNSRDPHQTRMLREGKSAAMPLKPNLKPSNFPVGQYPWQHAYIDHTQADVEIIHSRTGENLGRPYITIMVDHFSRRCLAVYVSFNPPSYRSIMMVIRECVRRFNRLPERLSVDRGKEFTGHELRYLAAAFQFKIETRPAAEPRFGTIVERIFGSMNEQLLYNLQGNTLLTKRLNPKIPKSKNPKVRATLTLQELYEKLRLFFYQVYDQEFTHSGLNATPKEMFDSGLKLSGKREMRFISYNEAFKILTLPLVKGSNGTRKISNRRNVKVKYISFAIQGAFPLKFLGKKCQVRYDPEDFRYVYVCIDGDWYKGVSKYHNQLYGVSETEVGWITSEYLRNRQEGSRKNLSERRIVSLLESFEANERQKAELMKKGESQDIDSMINGPESPEDPNGTSDGFPLEENHTPKDIPHDFDFSTFDPEE